MLNKENYHSIEMNKKYMSTSQFKSSMNCQAGAMAEIDGEFERDRSVSMLVGSYVDAHFSKDTDFALKNPEIFTRSGTLRSEFKHAEKIIERIKKDKLFMDHMNGETQVIKTGFIEGVEFKAMADVLHKDRIVDLKIMKDFKPQYKDGLYLDFIAFWGYDIQGAIYQEIFGEKLPFIIAVATKEAEPDINLIEIPQERLDYCLDLVKNNLEDIMLVKNGLAEPTRCGVCNYCKSTKVLKEIEIYQKIEK